VSEPLGKSERFTASVQCGTSDGMPTAQTDPQALAENAIAAARALAVADPYLAGALVLAIGAIRAKYPTVSAGPTDPPT
jgi:hypothetical protein